MRLVCISDTHNHQIEIPPGDILIHAGDATNTGTIDELQDFFIWFSSLPHEHKIFVAGNHDLLFERDKVSAMSLLDDRIIYLEDAWVVINDMKIYGSPWQPVFYEWAFCLPRGEMLAKKWKLIPDDVEILITHCPPYGILDEASDERGIVNEGCEELKRRVEILCKKKLKAHIFGHIHEANGVLEKYGVKFINASICDESNLPTRKPIVIDI